MNQDKDWLYYTVTVIFVGFIIFKGFAIFSESNKNNKENTMPDLNYSESSGEQAPSSPYYPYLEESPFGTSISSQQNDENTTQIQETETLPTAPPKNENAVFELTETEIQEMILGSMGEDSPFDSAEIDLKDDGTATVVLKGNKKEIFSYLKSKNISLPSAVSAVSFLLPNELVMVGLFTIDCDPESNLLKVGVSSLTVSDIAIPNTLYNSDIVDKANEKLNTYITEKGFYFTDIIVSDGKIVFEANSVQQ